MASLLERLRVKFWIFRNYPIYKYRCWRIRKDRERLQILDSESTVEKILSSQCSVARLGDGELQIISHYLENKAEDTFHVDSFQSYNPLLGKRLLEVLSTSQDNLLVCLPFPLKDSSRTNIFNVVFWDREWLGRHNFLKQYCLDRELGDTNFTRFYQGRVDIKNHDDYVLNLKKLWDNRDIVVVEGEFSRLGVGNDLFSNTASISRIICPAKSAFNKYDEILSFIRSQISTSKLLILALGQTATVLAYDLHALGYQALDLGHIDIEYEWYLRKSKDKIAIPNKYVNEVKEGRIEESTGVDEKYESEIIARIL